MPKHATSEENPTTTEKSVGGGRIKTLFMACGLLVLEAALIVGGFLFFSGPTEVAAEAELEFTTSEAARITEVMLIDEKLTNDRLGSVYVYPVEVYVHVPEDEQEWFDDLVGQYQHEIRAEMTALWRSADPVTLQDPRMEVMTRRIEALLRERFEGEPDPEISRIKKIVIVCGTGFRIRG